MATKKEAPVKRKFKRPSALADKPEVKKKVNMAKKPTSKPADHEKVSIVLDETHIELTEDSNPQEKPERQELADELFQEPVDSAEQKEMDNGELIMDNKESTKSTENKNLKTASVEQTTVNQAETATPEEDDQAKVDEMVNQSAVIDQPASSAETDSEELANGSSEQAAVSHEHTMTSGTDAATVEEGNGLRWILILIILFLVGLMGGLFYFFILQNKPVEKPKSPLKTVAVYTPSPTPASVTKNAFTIKVLNGSGVAGQAASVQTMLTSAGYNVVDIDNADNSDYTKTEIQAKSTVSKDFLTSLEQSLSDKYIVDPTVSPTKSDETDDVVVIIGSETK